MSEDSRAAKVANGVGVREVQKTSTKSKKSKSKRCGSEEHFTAKVANGVGVSTHFQNSPVILVKRWKRHR